MHKEFEKAARVRDQIRDLRTIQERQYVSGEKGDVDIIAMCSDAGYCFNTSVFIREAACWGIKITTQSLSSKTHLQAYYMPLLPSFIFKNWA